MDGRGWKPEYGISPEGIELLGYLEALPREARREMVREIARLCRRQGYLSLHDDLRSAVQEAAAPRPRQQGGKVIPLFRSRQRW